MSRVVAFYGSTLGKKVLMAVTGVILFGFVVGHMLGNLQIYLGPERLNHYAELLQSNKALLWTARSVLLASVLVHLLAAVQVWLRNRAARPVKYRVFNPPAVDYAARTMVWSGPLIAAFVVYHLLHLTVGTVNADKFVRGDVFANVVHGFSQPGVAIVYIIANALLAVHLYHGLWSLFQSFGFEHSRYYSWRRFIAVAFSALIAAGNISIPLAVLTGKVHL
jgi:succinate dehydrogenase / fumarate reductase, cytochrome b subunit